MDVTVRLFASLREHAGTRELRLDVADDATVADAVAALRLGALAGLPERAPIVAAVDREYVTREHPLRAGAELALVPPVSGGEGPVRLAGISDQPLDVDAARRLVGDARCGATVVFTGTTREVPSLEYEAHEDMAREVIARLAAEAAERHGLVAVAVEHRVGEVALMEPSIVVAASAPHRQAAFEGARDILDAVKAQAPIWKKEHYEDGDAAWVEGTLPQP